MIPFRIHDETREEIGISDFGTFDDLMNELYESDLLKGFNDKFAFWIYQVSKQNIFSK